MLIYGRELLLGLSVTSWNSTAYYGASGVWIALVLLPFCICMGATFPICMAVARHVCEESSKTSFSYLYVANVLGAMLGTIAAAYAMIELLGFRGTMLTAAALNSLIALLAYWLSFRIPVELKESISKHSIVSETTPQYDKKLLVLLFVTGLVSLAMEVIWTRLFTAYYGPVVYTFAMILFVYLGLVLDRFTYL